ncbi:hypothetical protein [Streptomyces sp. GQFP]|nr:hypothetical protein [Streptomyces sp. GQFP]
MVEGGLSGAAGEGEDYAGMCGLGGAVATATDRAEAVGGGPA